MITQLLNNRSLVSSKKMKMRNSGLVGLHIQVAMFALRSVVL